MATPVSLMTYFQQQVSASQSLVHCADGTVIAVTAPSDYAASDCVDALSALADQRVITHYAELASTNPAGEACFLVVRPRNPPGLAASDLQGGRPGSFSAA